MSSDNSKTGPPSTRSSGSNRNTPMPSPAKNSKLVTTGPGESRGTSLDFATAPFLELTNNKTGPPSTRSSGSNRNTPMPSPATNSKLVTTGPGGSRGTSLDRAIAPPLEIINNKTGPSSTRSSGSNRNTPMPSPAKNSKLVTTGPGGSRGTSLDRATAPPLDFFNKQPENEEKAVGRKTANDASSFEEEDGPQKPTRGPSLLRRLSSSLMMAEEPQLDPAFLRAESELQSSPHYSDLKARDFDATVLSTDWLAYKLENAIAADPNVRFYLLIAVSTVALAALACAWSSVADHDHERSRDLWGAVFLTFQVLITGGYDDTVLKVDERVVFASMIVAGVTIVSILIGLITDAVNEYMASLSQGSTKVVEEDHILILGWNEATARVITQIAFLRRSYQIQNETFMRKRLRYGRALPSTPIAVASVVVMTDLLEKEEMTAIVAASFSSQNISPHRTKLGRDVVFRKGDPCNNHDLVRVAAHKAKHVVVMMTAKDEAEALANPGSASNSATTRTVLALRNIVYSHGKVAETFPSEFTCVVQLSTACPYLKAVDLIARDGHDCLYPQDLQQFVNSLLFACATKPGISRVLMDLLGFEGHALRCRPPTQLRGGPRNELGWFVGKTMRECVLGHGWGDGLVVGCDDAGLNVPLDHRTKQRGGGGGGAGASGVGGPGIVSGPERIVRPDDFIVFVSEKSTPSVSLAPSDRLDFALEATPYLAKATNAKGPEHPVATKVLVCGWRTEWDRDPQRIFARVQSIALGMPQKQGSSVTLLNTHSSEDLNLLLAKAGGFVRSANGADWAVDCAGEGFVAVRHFQADPCEFEQVDLLFEHVASEVEASEEAPASGKHSSKTGQSHFAKTGNAGTVLPGTPAKVIKPAPFSQLNSNSVVKTTAPTTETSQSPVFTRKRDKSYFTSAIVLGTVYSEVLDSCARDSRVLATLLVLRTVCQRRHLTLHCVAENQQDQTSLLALAPPKVFEGQHAGFEHSEDHPAVHESDFVNTQAIVARSLAMNVAFPQMWDAVSELVSSVPNSPEVEFVEPFHLGILGKKVSFGAVQHIMCSAYKGTGVAIGVAVKSDIRLQPRLGEVFEWGTHHRVIVIARR